MAYNAAGARPGTVPSHYSTPAQNRIPGYATTATRRPTGQPFGRRESWHDKDRYTGQRNLAGPFGNLFPPERALRRQDVPLLEAGLNYENMLLSEQDRQQGYEQLRRGRAAIGTSLPSSLARELAVQRARGDGMGGVIRRSGGVAGEDLSRQIADQYASRGIGGGVPAVAQAEVQRSLASDIAERAARADEEYQRGALADLMGIGTREEGARASFDKALADLFLQTQREPFDFSSLALGVPKGKKEI